MGGRGLAHRAWACLWEEPVGSAVPRCTAGDPAPQEESSACITSPLLRRSRAVTGAEAVPGASTRLPVSLEGKSVRHSPLIPWARPQTLPASPPAPGRLPTPHAAPPAWLRAHRKVTSSIATVWPERRASSHQPRVLCLPPVSRLWLKLKGMPWPLRVRG